jgi:hypothetical protein
MMAMQPMGLWATLRHSFRVLWRAARELFHEVTGAVFFILAVAAIQASWRAWHNGGGRWLVGVTVGYAIVMVLFGVLSFRDSRRVR